MKQRENGYQIRSSYTNTPIRVPRHAQQERAGIGQASMNHGSWQRIGLAGLGLLMACSAAMAVDLEPLERQRLAQQENSRPQTSQPLEQQRVVQQQNPQTSQPLEQQMAPPPATQTQPRTAATNAKSKSAATQTDDKFILNFGQDAEIEGAIKTIAKLTGKNFIIDPRVKGKINIYSVTPVSKQAAYDIFLTALKAQGFTVADVRPGVVKIIPVGEGKQNASVRNYKLKRGAEEMVSHVVVIQHGTATQMVPLLRPLMAPTSQLSAYAPANALIITDYADNVQRLMVLIQEIDQPLSTDVTIIPLQHASALDMAELVSQLVQSSAPGRAAPKGAASIAAGSRTSIVPDLRTNSLLIRSDNPGRVAQLQNLIAKLDVPAKAEGNTRVIYLRNAEASKLVEVLRGLLEAEARAATPRAAAARGATSATGVQASLIQADEDTNSLIINAPDAVYNNLRGVIEKLDSRRAQVFVEAIIVEISHDKASQLGIQWAGGAGVGSEGPGQAGVAAITNFPATGSGIVGTTVDPTGLASAGGLTLAYIGEEVTVGTETVRGIGALVRALEERNIANILSTPNILTLDNAEAKIVVGQNVPFLTGSFTQTSTGADNPFQTIERKDVGVTLKIKPQVTEGGSVKLEISTEASSVAAGTLVAQDLITNTRTLETTVVVEDGHSIALGGLIRDSFDNNQQSVPFLGRIPLLGWLFKYREKKKGKVNLMVFLRPTIVRKPSDSYAFTRDRYDYILGEQRDVNKGKDSMKSLLKFKPTPQVDKFENEAYPEDDIPDEILEFNSGKSGTQELPAFGEDGLLGPPVSNDSEPQTPAEPMKEES